MMDQDDMTIEEYVDLLENLVSEFDICDSGGEDVFDTDGEDYFLPGPIQLPIICPLCEGPTADIGEHSLSSLPCGHAFGWGCINVFIEHESKCYLCNAHSVLSDIKILLIHGQVKIEQA
ncbi:uncharacterized protein LOC131022752 [Salvia miltiorrhiza]|uniref:uncharacterized protein LOC131022752 n=1 Tax=Salvia miltiorrhiza TaxID=226208 RepID=UPI0025AC8682|nr:uncharacterized protein LOC131022752 [Salvia miltiorrhiza]